MRAFAESLASSWPASLALASSFQSWDFLVNLADVCQRLARWRRPRDWGLARSKSHEHELAVSQTCA